MMNVKDTGSRFQLLQTQSRSGRSDLQSLLVDQRLNRRSYELDSNVGSPCCGEGLRMNDASSELNLWLHRHSLYRLSMRSQCLLQCQWLSEMDMRFQSGRLRAIVSIVCAVRGTP